MSKKRLLLLLAAGVFLCLDQFLKWQAQHAWFRFGTTRLVGWYPFYNPGVAFGIPVPGWIVLLLTIPVVIAILVHLHRQMWHLPDLGFFGLILIVFGAASNFIDRMAYHVTVDYFRIVTSVINLADVMIVVGFLLYFVSLGKKTRNKE